MRWSCEPFLRVRFCLVLIHRSWQAWSLVSDMVLGLRGLMRLEAQKCAYFPRAEEDFLYLLYTYLPFCPQ